MRSQFHKKREMYVYHIMIEIPVVSYRPVGCQH